MQTMASTSVLLQGPGRALPLSAINSPDDSIGEADGSGLYGSYLKQDCDTDTCLDLSGLALGEHTARQLILSLKRDEPRPVELAPLSSLRLANAQHLPVEVVLELLQSLHSRATQLVDLDLSNNGLGDEIADLLVSWLPPTLISLNLSGNRLTDTGAAALLSALHATGAPVEKLALSGNSLGPRSANLLRDLLQSSWSHSLRELSLSHCHLDDTSAPAVAEGVHHAVALTMLDVSHNRYALSLASPLSPQRPVTLPASLRSLNLSGNLFKPVLVRGLASSLMSCFENLEELRLSACLEGDDSLSTFFSLLRSAPSLRILDLSQCRLSYRSGKLLSQKLSVFSSLERVDLSNNLLGIEGVGDLSSGLSRMKCLTSLYLESCHLGNCGAVSVISSVARSGAPIREVVLCDNGITDVGIRDLCTQLTRDDSPKLSLLVLSKNPCTLQSRSQLEEMRRGRQCDCIVLARETPLDEVASSSGFDSETSSLV